MEIYEYRCLYVKSFTLHDISAEPAAEPAVARALEKTLEFFVAVSALRRKKKLKKSSNKWL